MSGQRLTIDRQLGARVRFARLNSHLSKAALAALIGVSAAQVMRFETGEDRISSDHLNDIAAALGQSVSFFFEGWIEDDVFASDRVSGRTEPFGLELRVPPFGMRARMIAPSRAIRKRIPAERDPDWSDQTRVRPYLQ